MDLTETREPADGVGSALAVVANDLHKAYHMGDLEVPALNGVDLRVAQGEFVAITGASGSGKSTLLNLLGLIDLPTGGSLLIADAETAWLSSNERAEVRLRRIGFVFQFFNLLLELSAIENVMLPAMLAGEPQTSCRARARELLDLVDLADRAGHRPSQLSGGQQQRVSIARALINKPALLLADEPTANLDSKRAAEIMELLVGLNKQAGQTIILVTHEAEYAAMAHRMVVLRDGKVVTDAASP